MNQKNNSVTSAETNDEVSANVDATTSSPNNAKPNVGGSFYPKDKTTKNKNMFDVLLTIEDIKGFNCKYCYK